MTIQEFRKLKLGTRVGWMEGKNSPQAGRVLEFGTVAADAAGRRFVQWSDGQETDGRDDAALQQVILPEEK